MKKTQSKLQSNICRVAVFVPLRQCFDYLIPDHLDSEFIQAGVRVVVPFGRQKKIGVIIHPKVDSTVNQSRLKSLESVIDIQPLFNQKDMLLLEWAARYYHHPMGEVISTALPGLLRKNCAAELPTENILHLTDAGQSISHDTFKRAPRQLELIKQLQNSPEKQLSTDQLYKLGIAWRQCLKGLVKKGLIQQKTQIANWDYAQSELSSPLDLTKAQQLAVDTVVKNINQFGVFLLDGVTGSGKTEVYMQLIQLALTQHKQVLVLLPEIALTPQLEERFCKRFPVPIGVYHSALSDKVRCTHWLRFQQGKTQILLGTRSATFIPMQQPGLIIMDEEHDPSFKQQEGFRFSARNVAIRRAQLLNIPILLGTATPAIETIHNAQSQRYRHLKLPARAGKAVMPELKLLDIRNRKMHSGLSEPLIQFIHKTLSRNEQVMLFINRRGYAPAYMCHQCGWVARCPRCDANAVVHDREQQLWCHHCGSNSALPKHCLACNGTEVEALGVGTERVENMLHQHFPDAKTARFDRDSVRTKAILDTMLTSVQNNEIDILIGTQMLAKGHHFPNVTLVCILDTDQGLFSTDFRAAERLAQMIIQVSGRAGRADKIGHVILQTRQPEHPLLQTLIRHDYARFAISSLQERQQADLPPFTHHALFRAKAPIPEAPMELLQQLRIELEKITDTILILGPVPAPMEKLAGQYRYQLLLQSQHRQELHHCLDRIIPYITTLKASKHTRWSVDLDPIDLY
jgi:primosomal protein N' (replication factor Y)